ncbi:unnamed protein product, partial [Ectocarpus sp. 8 AP-2014]
LSEVVGAFGSRLFDVLDASGVGFLDFETFVLGLSKLLKGPERERLKLLYSAYDLSGVAPSEERRKSSQSSGGSSSLSGGNSTFGGGGVGGGGKAKPSRRSKYLTLEDITAVLASASQAAAYPALLSFTTDGKGGMTTGHLSGGGVIGGGGGGTGGDGMFCCSCCWCCTGCNGEGCSGGGGAGAGAGGGENDRGLCGGGVCKRGAGKTPRNGGEGGLPSNQDSLRNSGEGRKEACGGGGGGSSSSSSSCGSGRNSRRGSSSARVSRDPEALAELLREMAQRNAERYAAAAVSEFGQAQGGAGLTQKEFEKWALTGPVLRCRINEFSIDLNLAPFQGVRLW